MQSEHEIIIAFLFKRSGKQNMGFSELYLELSMNLNWFPPEDAKKFLNDAIKKKLLLKEGEQILPAFDINIVTIPVGFTPTKKVFVEKKIQKDLEETNTFKKIVNKIAEKTNLSEDKIIEKINAISKEKNLLLELSALLVAKDYEIELNEFFKEIENKITNNL